jgi:prophage maintenance system killer protein
MSADVKAKSGGRGEVVIYQEQGRTALEVRLEQESLWLSLNQIASLFERDKSVVSRHLRNTFASGELARAATVAFFATAQEEGGRTVERQIEFFNLDAIISVGYRVNSKRGTQFRIWATSVLRDHLLQGYTVNERRLQELRQSLRLVSEVLQHHEVSTDEAKALLRVVTDFSLALTLLDDYDHRRVVPPELRRQEACGISHEEALSVVEQLRGRFGGSELFGREKDGSLRSSLAAVMQTFGGRDVYPGIEEKASNLLYFLVKNHPFVDGNKRIAAALFLWFLEKNGLLYRADQTKRLADNTLVAITLMTAESVPADKDLIVNLIIALIHTDP